MLHPPIARLRRDLFAILPILIALAPPVAHAQSSRELLVKRLDSLAGAPIHEGRAVGISAAVVRGTDTLLLKGYGKADLEHNVPTPDDAVYEIGSVTKQFTAAAILKLRDEGKLDLDADVTRYLPTYPTLGQKLPVRRLLDHTSGIKGMTEIPEFRSLRVRRLPRDSGVALFSALPFEFAPGEAMIYNNSAYFLLGLIVEKVSGVSYEDYVEQKLFAPLGMRSSRYCSNTEVVERRAHGYDYEGREIRRADYLDHTWPYAAGSLCSTARDLVTWLTALHGGKVLSQRSYAEMTTPARLNDGTELRYGMGLSIGTDVRGARHIGHGGAISGYTSDASWYPDAQLAVVVLMNSTGPVSPSALASELAGEIIPPKRPTFKPFSGDLGPLLGRYAGPSRGREMTVEVTQSAQGIAISVNGAAARPAAWVDGWSFRAGNVNLVFDRRDTTGRATVLRYDTGGGHYVLGRQ